MSEENLNTDPQEQEHHDEPQEPTLEDRARDRGWRPLEEFNGNEDDWVDAKEFIYRGELMDAISSKNKRIDQYERELQDVRGSVQDLKKHYEELAKAEVEERLAELKERKKSALSMSDHDSVVEIDEEMAELKEQKKLAEAASKEEPKNQPQNQVHPEVADWLKQNPWADDTSPQYNPALATKGMALLQAEAARQGGQVADVSGTLKAVKEDLMKLYPDHFGNDARTRAPTTPDVNSPSKRGGRGSIVSKLSADQKQIGERFVKAGAYEKLEDYAKDLQKMGEL